MSSTIYPTVPADQAVPRQTGEVLEREFKLIHGEDRWPSHDPNDENYTDMREQAARHASDQPDPGGNQDSREDAIRLAQYAWAVRSLPGSGQAALCLSGGGIRSAAFAFGILQGLARRHLLRQFHYLSTVSGGGYIGSWFTAWRHREGIDKVLRHLSEREFGKLSEPMPMQRLRFNQSFLTPRIGLASADTWAAVATVIRNLLLNWLVFLPLLAGVLLWPRIAQAFVELTWDTDVHSSVNTLLFGIHWTPGHCTVASMFHWRAWPCWLDSVALVFFVFGFTVSAFNRPANGATSMTQAKFVVWVVVPISIGAILLSAAVASWLDNMDGTWPELLRWVAVGAFIYLLARVIAVLVRLVAAMLRLIVAVLRHCQQPRNWRRILRQSRGMMRRSVFRHQSPKRGLKLILGELVAWAVAGACTGLLTGIGAQLCRVWVSESGTIAEPLLDLDRTAIRSLTVFGPPWIIVCFLIGEAVFVGATSLRLDGDRDREWLARAGGWFSIFAGVYLVFAWLVLFGWQYVHEAELRFSYLLAVGGSGLLTIFGAMTPLTRAVAGTGGKERLPLTGIVAVLSGLFVMGASAALAEATLDFLASFGSLTAWLASLMDVPMHAVRSVRDRMFIPQIELMFIIGTSILLLLGSALISIFVNVNWFSLHALYRNRLVNTFLGASNINKSGNLKAEGRNAFDGFSERDNIAMAELEETIRKERGPNGAARLYPVLNMSLNVVATKNLAWQERKAEPFICTPLYTGGDRVGYHESKLYAAGRSKLTDATDRGISLGTAMAISGAAISPNWGYHSSPITAFLMMLTNVRLGWWLGNPRHKGRFGRKSQTWRHRGPNFSWRLFLQEAMGWTDDEEPWIYLSDGGHFENLGIYEMVRRRCRTIVVSDAGADPNCTFEDLGNAVRKISIDLGVRIEFQRIHVRKRSDASVAGVYCAIGKIRYPEGLDGRIVYFKPGFYGRQEPADVRAYAAANAKFPHESTLNQWFSESQFESYRSLGEYVIEEICRDHASELSLKDFVAAVQDYLRKFERNYVTDGATIVDIRAQFRSYRPHSRCRRRHVRPEKSAAGTGEPATRPHAPSALTEDRRGLM